MAEESKRGDESAEGAAAAKCSPRSPWDWIDASLLIGMAAQFTATYNFTDSSIAVDLMARDGLTAPGWATSALYGSIFAGTILGQLTMGFLGDVLGRGAALAITFSITATGAVLSGALAVGSPLASYASVTAWRFVVGVGIGGTFPLSATAVSENSAAVPLAAPAVDLDGDDGECCDPAPPSHVPTATERLGWSYFGQVRRTRHALSRCVRRPATRRAAALALTPSAPPHPRPLVCFAARRAVRARRCRATWRRTLSS